MRGITLGFRAFTLIELMIVVSIIAILSLAAYIPYAYHQKKTLLNQGVRELSQVFSESKNLAINGISLENSNQHVGILFQKGSDELEIYYLPSGATIPADIPTFLNLYDPFKVKKLPHGIQLQDFSGENDAFLMIFEAIYGKALFLPEISEDVDELFFQLSFLDSQDSELQKKLYYSIPGSISDY